MDPGLSKNWVDLQAIEIAFGKWWYTTGLKATKNFSQAQFQLISFKVQSILLAFFGPFRHNYQSYAVNNQNFKLFNTAQGYGAQPWGPGLEFLWEGKTPENICLPIRGTSTTVPVFGHS